MAGADGAQRGEALPVGGLDRQLWSRLRVLVASRPWFVVLAQPTSEQMVHAGQRAVVRTVFELDQFADEVSARLLSGELPADRGSARAVAASVVRLTRAFTAAWSVRPVTSAARTAQFNRELALVAACLDSVAP